MKAKILIVDDQPDIVTVLRDRLEALGYDTVEASDGLRALEMLERETPAVMLLDLEMPRLSGLEVLKRLAQNRQAGANEQEVPVIVMTAHGTIAKAVEAMKEGACDFLTKPFEVDHLSIVIRKALEQESLKRQVECLRTEVETRYADIIGASPRTKSVVELAKRAANSDASVLLLGESGTGKELFARSIHQWSPRCATQLMTTNGMAHRGLHWWIERAKSSLPFVVINCVALTDTLLENELFRHEKGAYTGADRLQKGKVEMADGGTIRHLDLA